MGLRANVYYNIDYPHWSW